MPPSPLKNPKKTKKLHKTWSLLLFPVRQLIVFDSSLRSHDDILSAALWRIITSLVTWCHRSVNKNVSPTFQQIAPSSQSVKVHLVLPDGKKMCSLLQSVTRSNHAFSPALHLSIKRCCRAAAAQSPRRRLRAGSPHRCLAAACWCGHRPARTWTLYCQGGACRWGTAGRKRRSKRFSQGWRERQGKRWPRCMPLTGRAGLGLALARRKGEK